MKKMCKKMIKFFNKIFYEIDMSYKNVIIYAVITAIIIGILNVISILEGTSFTMPAATFEFWFVLALVVILNCKSYKDAVIKTFLYFLISQPLIYLVEVPFNDMGFELFGYYGYWFKWTILTIPGSFIAYYVKKQNILSCFILSVACGVLLQYGVDGFINAYCNFPYHLVSGIVCSFFAIYFIFLIFKNKRERIVCFIFTVIMYIIINVLMSMTSNNITTNYIIEKKGTWSIVSSEIDAYMSDNDDISLSTNKKGTYEVVLKNENDEHITLIVTYTRNGINVKEK